VCPKLSTFLGNEPDSIPPPGNCHQPPTTGSKRRGVRENSKVKSQVYLFFLPFPLPLSCPICPRSSQGVRSCSCPPTREAGAEAVRTRSRGTHNSPHSLANFNPSPSFNQKVATFAAPSKPQGNGTATGEIQVETTLRNPMQATVVGTARREDPIKV
jgi:hypothetical protein